MAYNPRWRGPVGPERGRHRPMRPPSLLPEPHSDLPFFHEHNTPRMRHPNYQQEAWRHNEPHNQREHHEPLNQWERGGFSSIAEINEHREWQRRDDVEINEHKEWHGPDDEELPPMDRFIPNQPRRGQQSISRPIRRGNEHPRVHQGRKHSIPPQRHTGDWHWDEEPDDASVGEYSAEPFSSPVFPGRHARGTGGGAPSLGRGMRHIAPNMRRGDPSMRRGVPSMRRGRQSVRRGDPSVRRGDPSMRRGDMSVRRGDPVVRRGDPSVRRGDLIVRRGDPSMRRGDPSLRRGDPSMRRGDPSLRRGDPSLRRGDQSARRGDPNMRRGGPSRGIPSSGQDLQTIANICRNAQAQDAPIIDRGDPSVRRGDPSVRRGGQSVGRGIPSSSRSLQNIANICRDAQARGEQNMGGGAPSAVRGKPRRGQPNVDVINRNQPIQRPMKRPALLPDPVKKKPLLEDPIVKQPLLPLPDAAKESTEIYELEDGEIVEEIEEDEDIAHGNEESGYVDEEMGYVGEEMGYVGEETGYVGEETGYVGEETGYVGEETGYVGEETGYVDEDLGYEDKEMGYVGEETGYVGEEMGYEEEEMGYEEENTTYEEGGTGYEFEETEGVYEVENMQFEAVEDENWQVYDTGQHEAPHGQYAHHTESRYEQNKFTNRHEVKRKTLLPDPVQKIPLLQDPIEIPKPIRPAILDKVRPPSIERVSPHMPLPFDLSASFIPSSVDILSECESSGFDKPVRRREHERRISSDKSHKTQVPTEDVYYSKRRSKAKQEHYPYGLLDRENTAEIQDREHVTEDESRYPPDETVTGTSSADPQEMSEKRIRQQIIEHQLPQNPIIIGRRPKNVASHTKQGPKGYQPNVHASLFALAGLAPEVGNIDKTKGKTMDNQSEHESALPPAPGGFEFGPSKREIIQESTNQPKVLNRGSRSNIPDTSDPAQALNKAKGNDASAAGSSASSRDNSVCKESLIQESQNVREEEQEAKVKLTLTLLEMQRTIHKIGEVIQFNKQNPSKSKDAETRQQSSTAKEKTDHHVKNDANNRAPKTPGQSFPPKTPGQSFPPKTPGQSFPPKTPGQSFPPKTPGQSFPPKTPGQSFPPKTPGQSFPPKTPGQSFPPKTPGQYLSNKTPGQNVPPKTPGQDLSSKTPGQDLSSKTPGQDLSSKTPGQYLSCKTPGQDLLSKTPGPNLSDVEDCDGAEVKGDAADTPMDTDNSTVASEDLATEVAAEEPANQAKESTPPDVEPTPVQEETRTVKDVIDGDQGNSDQWETKREYRTYKEWRQAKLALERKLAESCMNVDQSVDKKTTEPVANEKTSSSQHRYDSRKDNPRDSNESMTSRNYKGSSQPWKDQRGKKDEPERYKKDERDSNRSRQRSDRSGDRSFPKTEKRRYKSSNDRNEKESDRSRAELESDKSRVDRSSFWNRSDITTGDQRKKDDSPPKMSSSKTDASKSDDSKSDEVTSIVSKETTENSTDFTERMSTSRQTSKEERGKSPSVERHFSNFLRDDNQPDDESSTKKIDISVKDLNKLFESEKVGSKTVKAKVAQRSSRQSGKLSDKGDRKSLSSKSKGKFTSRAIISSSDSGSGSDSGAPSPLKESDLSAVEDLPMDSDEEAALLASDSEYASDTRKQHPQADKPIVMKELILKLEDIRKTKDYPKHLKVNWKVRRSSSAGKVLQTTQRAVLETSDSEEGAGQKVPYKKPKLVKIEKASPEKDMKKPKTPSRKESDSQSDSSKSYQPPKPISDNRNKDRKSSKDHGSTESKSVGDIERISVESMKSHEKEKSDSTLKTKPDQLDNKHDISDSGSQSESSKKSHRQESPSRSVKPDPDKSDQDKKSHESGHDSEKKSHKHKSKHESDRKSDKHKSKHESDRKSDKHKSKRESDRKSDKYKSEHESDRKSDIYKSKHDSDRKSDKHKDSDKDKEMLTKAIKQEPDLLGNKEDANESNSEIDYAKKYCQRLSPPRTENQSSDRRDADTPIINQEKAEYQSSKSQVDSVSDSASVIKHERKKSSDKTSKSERKGKEKHKENTQSGSRKSKSKIYSDSDSEGMKKHQKKDNSSKKKKDDSSKKKKDDSSHQKKDDSSHQKKDDSSHQKKDNSSKKKKSHSDKRDKDPMIKKELSDIVDAQDSDSESLSKKTSRLPKSEKQQTGEKDKKLHKRKSESKGSKVKTEIAIKQEKTEIAIKQEKTENAIKQESDVAKKMFSSDSDDSSQSDIFGRFEALLNKDIHSTQSTKPRDELKEKQRSTSGSKTDSSKKDKDQNKQRTRKDDKATITVEAKVTGRSSSQSGKLSDKGDRKSLSSKSKGKFTSRAIISSSDSGSGSDSGAPSPLKESDLSAVEDLPMDSDEGPSKKDKGQRKWKSPDKTTFKHRKSSEGVAVKKKELVKDLKKVDGILYWKHKKMKFPKIKLKRLKASDIVTLKKKLKFKVSKAGNIKLSDKYSKSSVIHAKEHLFKSLHTFNSDTLEAANKTRVLNVGHFFKKPGVEDSDDQSVHGESNSEDVVDTHSELEETKDGANESSDNEIKVTVSETETDSDAKLKGKHREKAKPQGSTSKKSLIKKKTEEIEPKRNIFNQIITPSTSKFVADKSQKEKEDISDIEIASTDSSQEIELTTIRNLPLQAVTMSNTVEQMKHNIMLPKLKPNTASRAGEAMQEKRKKHTTTTTDDSSSSDCILGMKHEDRKVKDKIVTEDTEVSGDITCLKDRVKKVNISTEFKDISSLDSLEEEVDTTKDSGKMYVSDSSLDSASAVTFESLKNRTMNLQQVDSNATTQSETSVSTANDNDSDFEEIDVGTNEVVINPGDKSTIEIHHDEDIGTLSEVSDLELALGEHFDFDITDEDISMEDQCRTLEDKLKKRKNPEDTTDTSDNEGGFPATSGKPKKYMKSDSNKTSQSGDLQNDKPGSSYEKEGGKHSSGTSSGEKGKRKKAPKKKNVDGTGNRKITKTAKFCLDADESGDEGDIEDNIAGEDTNTTPRSCRQDRADVAKANPEDRSDHGTIATKLTSDIENKLEKASAHQESITSKHTSNDDNQPDAVEIKEEPSWIGYTQQPDVYFLSDNDDDDILMSFSQPVITISSADEDDDNDDETQKYEVKVKEEMDDEVKASTSKVKEPVYDNFLSDLSDDLLDKGWDFDPTDVAAAAYNSIVSSKLGSYANASDSSLSSSEDIFRSTSKGSSQKLLPDLDGIDNTLTKQAAEVKTCGSDKTGSKVDQVVADHTKSIDSDLDEFSSSSHEILRTSILNFSREHKFSGSTVRTSESATGRIQQTANAEVMDDVKELGDPVLANRHVVVEIFDSTSPDEMEMNDQTCVQPAKTNSSTDNVKQHTLICESKLGTKCENSSEIVPLGSVELRENQAAATGQTGDEADELNDFELSDLEDPQTQAYTTLTSCSQRNRQLAKHLGIHYAAFDDSDEDGTESRVYDIPTQIDKHADPKPTVPRVDKSSHGKEMSSVEDVSHSKQAFTAGLSKQKAAAVEKDAPPKQKPTPAEAVTKRKVNLLKGMKERMRMLVATSKRSGNIQQDKGLEENSQFVSDDEDHRKEAESSIYEENTPPADVGSNVYDQDTDLDDYEQDTQRDRDEDCFHGATQVDVCTDGPEYIEVSSDDHETNEPTPTSANGDYMNDTQLVQDKILEKHPSFENDDEPVMYGHATLEDNEDPYAIQTFIETSPLHEDDKSSSEDNEARAYEMATQADSNEFGDTDSENGSSDVEPYDTETQANPSILAKKYLETGSNDIEPYELATLAEIIDRKHSDSDKSEIQPYQTATLVNEPTPNSANDDYMIDTQVVQDKILEKHPSFENDDEPVMYGHATLEDNEDPYAIQTFIETSPLHEDDMSSSEDNEAYTFDFDNLHSESGSNDIEPYDTAKQADHSILAKKYLETGSNDIEPYELATLAEIIDRKHSDSDKSEIQAYQAATLADSPVADHEESNNLHNQGDDNNRYLTATQVDDNVVTIAEDNQGDDNRYLTATQVDDNVVTIAEDNDVFSEDGMGEVEQTVQDTEDVNDAYFAATQAIGDDDVTEDELDKLKHAEDGHISEDGQGGIYFAMETQLGEIELDDYPVGDDEDPYAAATQVQLDTVGSDTGLKEAVDGENKKEERRSSTTISSSLHKRPYSDTSMASKSGVHVGGPTKKTKLIEKKTKIVEPQRLKTMAEKRSSGTFSSSTNMVAGRTGAGPIKQAQDTILTFSDSERHTKTDKWLSKTTGKRQKPERGGKRGKPGKRKRSADDPADSLRDLKARLYERSKQLAVQPEASLSHTAKTTRHGSGTPGQVNTEDVELPSCSQIVRMGLPVMNSTGLLTKKAKHAEAARVVTSTVSMVTSIKTTTTTATSTHMTASVISTSSATIAVSSIKLTTVSTNSATIAVPSTRLTTVSTNSATIALPSTRLTTVSTNSATIALPSTRLTTVSTSSATITVPSTRLTTVSTNSATIALPSTRLTTVSTNSATIALPSTRLTTVSTSSATIALPSTRLTTDSTSSATIALPSTRLTTDSTSSATIALPSTRLTTDSTNSATIALPSTRLTTDSTSSATIALPSTRLTTDSTSSATIALPSTRLTTDSTSSATIAVPSTRLTTVATSSATIALPSTRLTTDSTSSATIALPSTRLTTVSTSSATIAVPSTRLTTDSTSSATIAVPSTRLTTVATNSATIALPSTRLTTDSTSSATIAVPSTRLTTVSTSSATIALPSTRLTTDSTNSATIAVPSTRLTTDSTSLATIAVPFTLLKTVSTSSKAVAVPSIKLTTAMVGSTKPTVTVSVPVLSERPTTEQNRNIFESMSPRLEEKREHLSNQPSDPRRPHILSKGSSDCTKLSSKEKHKHGSAEVQRKRSLDVHKISAGSQEKGSGDVHKISAGSQEKGADNVLHKPNRDSIHKRCSGDLPSGNSSDIHGQSHGLGQIHGSDVRKHGRDVRKQTSTDSKNRNYSSKQSVHDRSSSSVDAHRQTSGDMCKIPRTGPVEVPKQQVSDVTQRHSSGAGTSLMEMHTVSHVTQRIDTKTGDSKRRKRSSSSHKDKTSDNSSGKYKHDKHKHARSEHTDRSRHSDSSKGRERYKEETPLQSRAQSTRRDPSKDNKTRKEEMPSSNKNDSRVVVVKSPSGLDISSSAKSASRQVTSSDTVAPTTALSVTSPSDRMNVCGKSADTIPAAVQPEASPNSHVPSSVLLQKKPSNVQSLTDAGRTSVVTAVPSCSSGQGRAVSPSPNSRVMSVPSCSNTGQGRAPLSTINQQGRQPLSTNTGQGRAPISTYTGKGKQPLSSNTGQGRAPISTHTGKGKQPLSSNIGKGRQPFTPLVSPNGDGEQMPRNIVDQGYSIKWEDFLYAFLTWNIDWFSEREKFERDLKRRQVPAPPPLLDGWFKQKLFPLLGQYQTYREYCENFMVPLLLHETWETCYSSWLEDKRAQRLRSHRMWINSIIRLPDVEHIKKKQQSCNKAESRFIAYYLYGLISEKDRRARKSFLKEEDLVRFSVTGELTTKNGVEEKEERWTGLVVKAAFNEIPVQRIYKQNKELRELGSRNRGKAEVSFTVTVVVNRKQHLFKPNINKAITLESVCAIVTTKRHFTGLAKLASNPLCPHLLYPTTSDRTYYDMAPKSPLETKENYNASQSAVINTAVKLSKLPASIARVCIVQGPPGTGKSHTICAIIRKIIQSQDKSRVCLCAPSNGAIDELLGRLIKISREMKIVRLGREESVRDSIKSRLLDKLVKNNILREEQQSQLPPSLKKAISNLDTSIKGKYQKMEQEKDPYLKQKFSTDLKKLKKEKENLMNKCEVDMTNIPRKVKEEQALNIMAGAHVIAGTLNSIGMQRVQNIFQTLARKDQQAFTCIIIDEATQAVELDALIPLQYGCSKLILVGDPEQLQPTVKSQVCMTNKYNQSLLERLDGYFKLCDHPSPVMLLDTQYRMHPDISHFPNKYVYEGRLKDDKSVMNRTSCFTPYMLYNIVDGTEAFSQTSKSLSNIEEALFVAELCKYIVKTKPEIEPFIGVIVPYNKQRCQINEELKKRKLQKIEVSTVDGFQGREKDVIVMSCVRANDFGNLGFMGSRKRMNVLLTRAKYAMYIVANLDSLRTNDEWKALIADAEKRKKVVKVNGSDLKSSLRTCLINRGS